MRRRWLLAVLCVAALAASAGCTGTSTVSDSQLAQNATYGWGQNATVAVNVTDGQYRAVVNVTGANATQLQFSQSSQLGGSSPIAISALQFRYPNGTVVNASAFDVSQSNKAVTVKPPATAGELAYTAPAGGHSVSLPGIVSGGSHSVSIPALVAGSYDVTLPAGMRVGLPVVSDVSPGGYRTVTTGDRVRVRWASVDAGSTVSVQYYRLRDLAIFGGLIGIALLAVVLVVVYFRLKIRRLEREREESGLDVE